MNIYLGENIKRLRREKELTQERLAEFLGVTFQSVSNWERGETYPDITMLPEIAGFFKASVDDLLGVNKAEAQRKIEEYLKLYKEARLKDTGLVFEKFQTAVKEFPSDFRILVRYMELLMCEKTTTDIPEYEKASKEIIAIYDNIQGNCTDDSIRMWSKRLICQHLHTKAHITKNEDYQLQAEKIIEEMPDMINSKDYLSTMLLSDKTKHYDACSKAIENLLFLLEHSVDHYCLYDDSFSPSYKIEALSKMLTVYDLFYTDGNYGKHWQDVIYNHGHLTHLYHQTGDNENALKHLKLCVEFAKKYDELPVVSERKAQFFEGRSFEKTNQGHTMCQRMNRLITEKYPLSDEFKKSEEFQNILKELNGN